MPRKKTVATSTVPKLKKYMNQPRMVRLSTVIVICAITNLFLISIGVAIFAVTQESAWPNETDSSPREKTTKSTEQGNTSTNAEASLELVVSAGKEVCLGDDIVIQWKGDPSIEYVSLLLSTPRTNGQLGDFPLGYNEGELTTGVEGKYTWQTSQPRYGRPVEENLLYSITAHGRFKDGGMTSIVRSDTFALRNCPVLSPYTESEVIVN